MPDATNNPVPPAAIIMAAGKGTRMGSDLPKVLHEVAGKPMLRWVTEACYAAGVETCVVVVGYRGDDVRKALADDPRCEFVEQTEQLGTAHAADMARPVFENRPAGDVFVLAGDGPLIRSQTLARLLELHRRTKASATLATAVLSDPSGYGRVVRNASGGFDRIVEQKDATPEELAVQEVNPSYYCFRSDDLFTTLTQVSNANQQGEYYITDVPGILRGQGKTVSVVDAVPEEDVLSINNPQQLAEVDAILKQRLSPGAPA
ncbi:sugar phosphate nucleotidyltransferase [Algisphaera agarilytica]|uniref:Bifunctional UDP-N-acetylglucosamine pyrophosphorylase/glucosamine-1-phosphate N-acetyltransferase n=1 Tax=Algisphaera agarilytica TaxID=1385975 RepID=A0A7X0LLD1_9BACT|nr:NTP transferase domain-containing protein [Algisphaera agarilytica]MBB6430892.1 bifunctional UDP-N-acetylglucosamine pyrophosphorylase/glucosamine-1-phosphate N-acetyltransferase [Algisphaera agarilytica]